MDALYHYTDLNAFLNILQTKKLWLTGVNNLNDHQEVNWTINKIRKKLFDIANSHGDERPKIIWELLNASIGVPHICSLSSESDLLSQWRAYSKDGTGVAIGFKKNALPASKRLPILTFAKEDSLVLHQVIYDENKQDDLIDRALEPAFGSGKITDEEHLAMSLAANTLHGLSCVFKNAAFHEEKEWRIIHRPIIMGKPGTLDSKIHHSISPPKYRIAGGKLLAYFEYEFNKSVTDIFAELILGPKCEISNYDLSILLSEKGLENLPVRRSKASYR